MPSPTQYIYVKVKEEKKKNVINMEEEADKKE
jgi:hypothetical protein